MATLTDAAAQRIAQLAIQADRADRELFQLERTARGQTLRDARRTLDQAKVALADAIDRALKGHVDGQV